MQAMSTSKILILSALLRDKRGVQNLTAEQRALALAAVTESDNNAILALFDDLEADRGGLLRASAYATGLLREVGDEQTQVTTAPPPAGYATTFGQTPWTPAAEVTFFRSLALGCVLPPGDTSYVLGLMRSIEPSESFGLGSAGCRRSRSREAGGPSPTTNTACARPASSAGAIPGSSWRSLPTPSVRSRPVNRCSTGSPNGYRRKYESSRAHQLRARRDQP